MSKARGLADLGNAYSDGALSNRNKLINGGMVIDQRHNGAAVSNANGYIADRWTVGKYGPNGGEYTAQQVADAPNGLKNSLRLTTTAVPSSNTNQFFQMQQSIEGYSIAELSFGTANAATFTFSFWVKSSLTGTFCAAFTNNQSTTRSYIATYTINAANTWEYKTITVAGDTSAVGNWGSTNGQGLSVFFDIGSGTAQEATTANSWQTGNFRRIAGAVSVIGTSGATFYITGVQLEVGDTATPFEHRSFGQELALCQRYYNEYSYSEGGGVGAKYGAGAITNRPNAAITYPTVMRANPTFTQLTAPSLTRCTEGSHLITLNGITVRVNCTSTGDYRMIGGLFSLDAEL